MNHFILPINCIFTIINLQTKIKFSEKVNIRRAQNYDNNGNWTYILASMAGYSFRTTKMI